MKSDLNDKSNLRRRRGKEIDWRRKKAQSHVHVKRHSGRGGGTLRAGGAERGIHWGVPVSRKEEAG